MQCVICKSFLPPGFTEQIENTKYYKCVFCIQGKDKILKHNPTTGDIYWDIKSEIVFDYKQLCDSIASRSDVRSNFLSGIKE